jgi:hypothetical protein
VEELASGRILTGAERNRTDLPTHPGLYTLSSAVQSAVFPSLRRRREQSMFADSPTPFLCSLREYYCRSVPVTSLFRTAVCLKLPNRRRL